MNKIDLHITAQRLQEWRACPDQYNLFVRRFPDGITLTRELLLKHAASFDLRWLARTLLSGEQWLAYCNACATAWAVYEKACATAWADYDNVYAPARAAYEKAVATAWADYDNVYATAFADILSLP